MAYFHRVHTFSEMRKISAAFAAKDSQLGFVVVVGRPGVGKTNTLRKEINVDAFTIESVTTPFGLYTAAWEHRDASIIILDDVDSIISTPSGVNLLKMVCQTDPVKRISWNTTAADKAGIPRSFESRARVLLIANEFVGKGANFQAVLDRGHRYQFSPSAEELHREVGIWPPGKVDPEVYGFIGQNLYRIPEPSFRDYVLATELKPSGLDWRASLRARWEDDPKFSAAAEIVHLARAGKPELATAAGRAKQFMDWGMGSRSTYLQYQRKVLEMLGLSRLAKAKPATTVQTSVKASTRAQKQSDFRTLGNLTPKMSESPTAGQFPNPVQLSGGTDDR